MHPYISALISLDHVNSRVENFTRMLAMRLEVGVKRYILHARYIS